MTPSGSAQTIIDETVWDIAREPIAQTFSYGKQFVTVVANHFKSKSGTDPTPAGRTGRLQRRTSEAVQVAAHVRERHREGQQVRRLPRGDFNSYAKEDPIKVFTDAGWSDLLFTHARGQYTYTFDGELARSIT